MDVQELERTARALVAEGKGILAADESTGTIKKRFDSIDVESTEENRRAYRQLLFTTPGASDHISGVILFDETIRQATDDGTPFPEFLASEGIIPSAAITSGNGLPSEVAWRIVSSKRITPLTNRPRPGVVNSISR